MFIETIKFNEVFGSQGYVVVSHTWYCHAQNRERCRTCLCFPGLMASGTNRRCCHWNAVVGMGSIIHAVHAHLFILSSGGKKLCILLCPGSSLTAVALANMPVSATEFLNLITKGGIIYVNFLCFSTFSFSGQGKAKLAK